MTKKLKKLQSNILLATMELEQAIYDEIDKVARKHKLDEMSFFYTTLLKRNGKEVSVQEITKLDYFFCDNICKGGFLALWTKEKGWC